MHGCKGSYMWKWIWRWRVDIQFMFGVSWALHKNAGRERLETALKFTAPYNRILYRDLGLTSRVWLNTSYFASPQGDRNRIIYCTTPDRNKLHRVPLRGDGCACVTLSQVTWTVDRWYSLICWSEKWKLFEFCWMLSVLHKTKYENTNKTN